MILVNGSILSSDEIINILPTLEKRVCKTLQKPFLNPMLVVEACHQLAVKIESGCYQELIRQLITEGNITTEQIKTAINMFKRESLLYKLNFELDIDTDKKLSITDHRNGFIRVRRMPLGVLFHIAAGNVDGLPAYSVVEGLLAGNINILKLPAADHGLTIKLLNELVKLEPVLSDYIYVFDISSNDLTSMQTMAKCADAIVVWGGDTAIREVRKLATPNTRIIEWGHKISFAYITEQGMMMDSELTELAHHMLSTKQLLCSSCQGIYLDTHEESDIYHFSERFITILEKVARDYPSPGVGIQAQLTLMIYNQELDAYKSGKRVYHGENCSILASSDKKLEVSFTYGNCWVKSLPRKYIITRLHRYKGYLQTVGLLCGQKEREELSNILLKAGATRVTHVGDMSRMLSGEAHDGEYPLQRYSKIVEYDES